MWCILVAVISLYHGSCREVEFNAAELEVVKKGRREIKIWERIDKVYISL